MGGFGRVMARVPVETSCRENGLHIERTIYIMFSKNAVVDAVGVGEPSAMILAAWEEFAVASFAEESLL